MNSRTAGITAEIKIDSDTHLSAEPMDWVMVRAERRQNRFLISRDHLLKRQLRGSLGSKSWCDMYRGVIAATAEQHRLNAEDDRYYRSSSVLKSFPEQNRYEW